MTHAVVREVNGQLVLDDPEALGVIRAVAKYNCKVTLELHTESVEHFRRRLVERGDNPADVMIVILAVDDIHGGMLAEAIMPGMNWQPFRDRGEIPYARGLAGRVGIQEALDTIDPEAGAELRALVGFAIVVVDHQVAAVFPA